MEKPLASFWMLASRPEGLNVKNNRISRPSGRVVQTKPPGREHHARCPVCIMHVLK